MSQSKPLEGFGGDNMTDPVQEPDTDEVKPTPMDPGDDNAEGTKSED